MLLRPLAKLFETIWGGDLKHYLSPALCRRHEGALLRGGQKQVPLGSSVLMRHHWRCVQGAWHFRALLKVLAEVQLEMSQGVPSGCE